MSSLPEAQPGAQGDAGLRFGLFSPSLVRPRPLALALGFRFFDLRNNNMNFCTKLLFTFCFLVMSNLTWANVFDLEFNQNGILPSATYQGLVYGASSSVQESYAFTISNGFLHLNTTQYPNDVTAYYLSPPVYYNHNYAVRMVASVRVLSGNGQGITFAFMDTKYSGIFSINRGGWALYGIPSANGTIANPDIFHEFSLSAAPNTGAYEFRIDGLIVSTGTLPSGYPSAVYFGDGTPTGGNVTADVDYIRYSNPDNTIGIVGATGPQGPVGATGSQGVPGVKGDKGDPGSPGSYVCVDGNSSYQGVDNKGNQIWYPISNSCSSKCTTIGLSPCSIADTTVSTATSTTTFKGCSARSGMNPSGTGACCKC